MTRLTGRAAPPKAVDVVLDLLLGSRGDFTDEELRLAWEAYGASLHDEGVGRGWRPWGYWKFEIGEEPPEDRQEPRLAELGLLTEEEFAKVADAAVSAREFLAQGPPFYHGSDEGCRQTVELYEAVKRACRS